MTVAHPSRRLLVLSLCLTLFAGIATPCSADVVSSFDGTVNTFSLSADTLSSPAGGASVTMVNGNAISPTFSGSFGSLGINPTPVAGPSGFTTYNATGNETLSLTDGTNTANFTISNIQLLVPDAIPNDILLSGLITFASGSPLTSGASTFDFSSVSGLTFSQTLNGSTNFNTVIQGAGTANGTDSFSVFSGSFVPSVPEPSSLALWSILGMAGVWYARRRPQEKLAV